jgi:UDP-N-acetylmuramyl pentapeptide phosphotransferase/UDP-N-acetylglucosamine-1-phosphate transferase
MSKRHNKKREEDTSKSTKQQIAPFIGGFFILIGYWFLSIIPKNSWQGEDRGFIIFLMIGIGLIIGGIYTLYTSYANPDKFL